MPPRLIHLNGAPGVGKSTLARRYAVDHPGVLLLDQDLLGDLLPASSFDEVWTYVRPLALAMVTAHLSGGHDVVLPQYLGRVSEVERYAKAAATGEGRFVEVLLEGDPGGVADRFGRRGTTDPGDHHDRVRAFVRAAGGPRHLDAMVERLHDVTGARPYLRVRSVEGEVEATYAALLEVLDL